MMSLAYKEHVEIQPVQLVQNSLTIAYRRNHDHID